MDDRHPQGGRPGRHREEDGRGGDRRDLQGARRRSAQAALQERVRQLPRQERERRRAEDDGPEPRRLHDRGPEVPGRVRRQAGRRADQVGDRQADRRQDAKFARGDGRCDRRRPDEGLGEAADRRRRSRRSPRRRWCRRCRSSVARGTLPRPPGAQARRPNQSTDSDAAASTSIAATSASSAASSVSRVCTCSREPRFS